MCAVHGPRASRFTTTRRTRRTSTCRSRGATSLGLFFPEGISARLGWRTEIGTPKNNSPQRRRGRGGPMREESVVLSAGAVQPGLVKVIDAFRHETGDEVKVTFATAPTIRKRLHPC